LSGVLGAYNPLTRLYIGLCVAIYLFTALRGSFSFLGGIPVSEALRWGALWGPLGRSEPWRYLSAMFVHFGILHILFNMMTLNDLGRLLEPRLGSARYVIAFLITGVCGFVVSDFWYSWTGTLTLTAGASGGLTGLIGVLIGFLYAHRDPAWKQVLTRVAVYAVILAMLMPVNNAAHLGGFVAGLPFGYLFGRERRPWQRNAVFAALAGLCVVASFASIALSHLAPVWKEARQEELHRGLDR
jgi:rhomboid protease GluP